MDMTCARNWARDPRGQNCTGTCVQYQQVGFDLAHLWLVAYINRVFCFFYGLCCCWWHLKSDTFRVFSQTSSIWVMISICLPPPCMLTIVVSTFYQLICLHINWKDCHEIWHTHSCPPSDPVLIPSTVSSVCQPDRCCVSNGQVCVCVYACLSLTNKEGERLQQMSTSPTRH